MADRRRHRSLPFRNGLRARRRGRLGGHRLRRRLRLHGCDLRIVLLGLLRLVFRHHPVGFVGLVVPHIVRLAISMDYRWVIPFSAVIGAIMVVLADLAGRIILANQSFPVGVTMALIGAPFFLWLARYRTGAGKS